MCPLFLQRALLRFIPHPVVTSEGELRERVMVIGSCLLAIEADAAPPGHSCKGHIGEHCSVCHAWLVMKNQFSSKMLANCTQHHFIPFPCQARKKHHKVTPDVLSDFQNWQMQ